MRASPPELQTTVVIRTVQSVAAACDLIFKAACVQMMFGTKRGDGQSHGHRTHLRYFLEGLPCIHLR